jgi:hypothetical protein
MRIPKLIPTAAVQVLYDVVDVVIVRTFRAMQADPALLLTPAVVAATVQSLGDAGPGILIHFAEVAMLHPGHDDFAAVSFGDGTVWEGEPDEVVRWLHQRVYDITTDTVEEMLAQPAMVIGKGATLEDCLVLLVAAKFHEKMAKLGYAARELGSKLDVHTEFADQELVSATIFVMAQYPEAILLLDVPSADLLPVSFITSLSFDVMREHSHWLEVDDMAVRRLCQHLHNRARQVPAAKAAEAWAKFSALSAAAA